MTSDSNITKDTLHDWVEWETRPVDVVASWEQLCNVYKTLEFQDPMTDAVKLEEFKWIIKQMNTFLTTQRKKLIGCRSPEAMMELLSTTFTPTGKVNIDNRKSLAFQKLRQMWIKMRLGDLKEFIEKNKEESKDGWTDGNAE